jgi:hypothetical protein
MVVRVTAALVVSVWLVVGVGCDHLNDKNGNPYSQGPSGAGCSWVDRRIGPRPEFLGPPQKNSFGQTCQTFQRGSIYETRCE